MELTGVCPLSATAVEVRKVDILYCGGTVVTSAARLTFWGGLFCVCDVGGFQDAPLGQQSCSSAAFMLILTEAAKLKIASLFSVTIF